MLTISHKSVTFQPYFNSIERSLEEFLPSEVRDELLSKELPETKREYYARVLGALEIIGAVIHSLVLDEAIHSPKVLHLDLNEGRITIGIKYNNVTDFEEVKVTVPLVWGRIDRIAATLLRELKNEAKQDFEITKEGRVA